MRVRSGAVVGIDDLGPELPHGADGLGDRHRERQVHRDAGDEREGGAQQSDGAGGGKAQAAAGCDRKWRTDFAELCSVVSVSWIWQGARRFLGAGQETAPAGRRPAMQRSAICSVEQINLESRKAGTEAAKLRSSCFPAFQILSPARVFIRASATLTRFPRPPHPMATRCGQGADGCFALLSRRAESTFVPRGRSQHIALRDRLGGIDDGKDRIPAKRSREMSTHWI